MQTVSEPQPIVVQLLDLVLVQLSNWRWTWRSMIILGIVAPLSSMLALGIFARDSSPHALAYVLTGNIVLALMFDIMSKVSSNFSFMRAMGTLNFFATLPIQRYNLIIASVISFLVLSLPSLLITTLLGAFFLRIPLHPNPLILLVIPLAAIPLAGIGAAIGVSARNQEEAGSLTTLLSFVMLGLGPVIIPPDRLPDFMIALGHISPATYAASALRQVLLEPVTWRIALDAAVLAGMAALSLGDATYRMDWRQMG